MGKGDTPRKVNKDKYDGNYDQINWSKKDKANKEDEDVINSK